MKLLPKLGNVLFGMPTLVFLFCLPPALSDNWNRFRGPDGAGSLKTGEFPTSWTEKDYTWSCKLPGVGHSSPVLWGEKLFTTRASESTGEQFVLCLDAKSAKSFGKKTFPSKVYPHHNSTVLHPPLPVSTPSTSSYPGPPRNRTTFFVWTIMAPLFGVGISGDFKPSTGTDFPLSWKAKSWSSPTTMK